jgi:hypothetical protein
MGDPGPQARREVRVRLIGEPADIEAVAGALAASLAAEVVTRSKEKPNRYDPGVRVYLTVWVGGEVPG